MTLGRYPLSIFCSRGTRQHVGWVAFALPLCALVAPDRRVMSVLAAQFAHSLHEANKHRLLSDN